MAKRVVWQAKLDAEKDKFANISPNDGSVFTLAKQMDRSNQDVVGEKCVKHDAGELSPSEEEKMKAWVEYEGCSQSFGTSAIILLSINIFQ